MSEMKEKDALVIAYAKTKIRSYVVITIELVAYSVFVFFFAPSYINRPIMFLVLGVGFLAFVCAWVTNYRLKHGLLGNNKYEAREIIRFSRKFPKKDR